MGMTRAILVGQERVWVGHGLPSLIARTASAKSNVHPVLMTSLVHCHLCCWWCVQRCRWRSASFSTSRPSTTKYLTARRRHRRRPPASPSTTATAGRSSSPARPSCAPWSPPSTTSRSTFDEESTSRRPTTTTERRCSPKSRWLTTKSRRWTGDSRCDTPTSPRPSSVQQTARQLIPLTHRLPSPTHAHFFWSSVFHFQTFLHVAASVMKP